MVGDGLNDAGALMQADTGVAVNDSNTQFTPACDAILHADEFARLPQYVRLAQEGVKIVNRAYYIAFIYNVIGLSYAVTGVLSPLVAAILMPLSSLCTLSLVAWTFRRESAVQTAPHPSPLRRGARNPSWRSTGVAVAVFLH